MPTLTDTKPTSRDVLLLVARILLGVVLIAHGVQKLQNGMSGVAKGFEGMGVPLPTLSAIFATVAELGGGALLLLGLFSPLAALIVVIDMAGAFWFAHKGSGPFVADGGWELVVVIAAAAIAVGANPGRLSLDSALFRRNLTTKEAAPIAS